MRKVKRWKYYCDFCKKSGGHAGYMREHELSCTMNPNRRCGLCDYGEGTEAAIEDLKKPLLSLAERVHEDEWGSLQIIGMIDGEMEGALEELREVSGDCPACILAALRQTNLAWAFMDIFDFKKEKDAIFAGHNREHTEAIGGY